MPRISVIVPARDAAPTIGRTLAALAEQDLREPYEVIVVDDGSRDGTVAQAEAAPGAVSVVRQPGRGPAAARNRGAAAANGQILAFTDADCVPHRGWLSEGLRALSSADLVQGRVRPEPGARRHPFDRTLWVDREIGLYETANLFVRKELFDRLGGFEAWLEQEIGKELAEDAWFGWRARRAGARTAFCPDALVDHAVFRRGALEYVGERRRLTYFADIAVKIPEIRRQMFFGRFFLNRRTAAFDAALIAACGAAAVRSPLPLVLGVPYLALVIGRSKGWRTRAPAAAVVGIAADAVGLFALVQGSLRRRTLVL